MLSLHPIILVFWSQPIDLLQTRFLWQGVTSLKFLDTCSIFHQVKMSGLLSIVSQALLILYCSSDIVHHCQLSPSLQDQGEWELLLYSYIGVAVSHLFFFALQTLNQKINSVISQEGWFTNEVIDPVLGQRGTFLSCSLTYLLNTTLLKMSMTPKHSNGWLIGSPRDAIVLLWIILWSSLCCDDQESVWQLQRWFAADWALMQASCFLGLSLDENLFSLWSGQIFAFDDYCPWKLLFAHHKNVLINLHLVTLKRRWV